MNTTNSHIDLIERRQKLQEIAALLKNRFLGLDDVIDEIISLISPWYIFPEAQRRPTVINLWGLTGSGKTALVQSLVEFLDHRKLYTHVDMGEFESDSASWMKSIFTDDLAFFHEKPALICLDEFQFAKTLDANSNELGKDKLRVIWDILDSGMVEYLPCNGTHYLFRADNCLRRLDKAIKNGVVVEKGEVVLELEMFLNVFNGFYFDRHGVTLSSDYFLSDDFVDGMEALFESDEYSKEQIRQRIKSATLSDLKNFIHEGLRSRPATKILDLSHSLIFVLGNLDEAYTMSRSMNPDISADDFYEQTSKITIADIKKALRKRFRSEQIARLGNNHVIYKSFNNAQFRLLIKQELDRIGDFVLKRFGWKVTFDDSVINVVYAEGVFPAQGTRPVFSTVKNLIESRVSTLIVSVLEYQLTVAEINWRYNDETFTYTIKDQYGETVSILSDKAKLKLENLRKSVDPELQAHTAVHEAGHAILAALTLRIVPSLVVSRTASDMEGFCMVNFPKGPVTRKTLKKDIIISLGGYVAERLIFGDEYTCSGVYADIEEASALANKAVRKYAMGSDPIHLAVKSSQNEDAFYQVEAYAAEAVAMVKACELEATLLLQRNKLLLLKMAEYLTSHSRMEETLIEDYVKKYSIEAWVNEEGFVKKENYYCFNKEIQQQLHALTNEDEGTFAANSLIVNR